VHHVIDGSDIETTSPHFVRQLAVELMVARRRRHRPLWWMAWVNHGRFTRRQLRDAERGQLALTRETVSDLAAVYGVNPAYLLPGDRSSLDIRADGLLSSGGETVTFTPGDAGSLIAAYIQLTRKLRVTDDAAAIPLRRDDLRAIGRFLERTGTPSLYLDALLTASAAEDQLMSGSVVAGVASIDLVDRTAEDEPVVVDSDGSVAG
jgi:hypothetical protein